MMMVRQLGETTVKREMMLKMMFQMSSFYVSVGCRNVNCKHILAVLLYKTLWILFHLFLLISVKKVLLIKT